MELPIGLTVEVNTAEFIVHPKVDRVYTYVEAFALG